MRTTKRFTPAVLRRFKKQGRGTGIYADYIPWHRVGRGDPASAGRSHLRMFRGIQLDLLSDGELAALFWIAMLDNVIDIRVQFPLSLAPAAHELGAYRLLPADCLPGTLEIARQLGIRHPRVNGKGESDWWIPSTDFLVTLQWPGHQPTLLAVCCKESVELTRKRPREKVLLEQHYWQIRESEWLLITEQESDPQAVDTLARTAGWALDPPEPDEAIRQALETLHKMPDCSETCFIRALGDRLGNEEAAKRALWQGVWRGFIPLDLRRGWRPHQPLRLLTPEAFRALNPIASRRSAWN